MLTSRRRARQRAFRAGGIAFCVAVYTILFLPIVSVVAGSFNANDAPPYLAWEGFTLKWYAKLFHNESLLTAFANTMMLAVLSTALATALGTLAAIGLYRYRFRGKSIIDGMLYIPVVIPEIVMGVSLLMFFVNVQIPRGMVALVIAHTTFCVSFVIFNVRARLDGYDSSLEEASMDLGAGRIATFLQVTLPMLAPGIVGGALLAFTISLDDVVVSYFVYGQDMTFPLMVMQSIKTGVTPDINALSTLILLGTALLATCTQGGLFGRVKRAVKRRTTRGEGR